MTEPIEKWQLEFYEEMAKLNPVKFTFVGGIPIVDHRSGKSAQLVVGIAWKIFIAAKRSQPVVELPRLGDFHIATSLSYKNMIDSLTATGINYRIKGE